MFIDFLAIVFCVVLGFNTGHVWEGLLAAVVYALLTGLLLINCGVRLGTVLLMMTGLGLLFGEFGDG